MSRTLRPVNTGRRCPEGADEGQRISVNELRFRIFQAKRHQACANLIAITKFAAHFRVIALPPIRPSATFSPRAGRRLRTSIFP